MCVPGKVSGEKESYILAESLGGTEDKAGMREDLYHQIYQLIWVRRSLRACVRVCHV